MVLSEIGPDAGPALSAVRLLAQYLKGGDAAGALEAVTAGLADPSSASNPTFLWVAAQVRFLEGDVPGALAVAGPARSLELLALSVQALLSIYRPDAAEKQLRTMSSLDDDATLTQLATAWVGLARGGARAREASAIFQELGDRFSWTPRLHAGLAAAQMRMGQWEEAEAELMQATEKNPKDPDVLANLVVVSLNLGKPATRHLALLRDVAPRHALLAKRDAAEEAFNRAASAVVA